MPALYLYSLQPVSSYVAVKYRLHNVDTDEITIVIELDNGESKIEKEFQRTILSKTEIKQLLLFGVKFLEISCDKLLEYLLRSEAEAATLHIHTNLGWDKFHSQSVFKCHNILYRSEDYSQIDSKYSGVLDITPTGKLSVWLDTVKCEVLGNTPLTICLLLGFAAPILAYLTDKYDLGSLIFSLAQDSSKGKSTSAMLAVSVFSNPILNCGTMRSFNNTQNFLLTFLSQACGFPIALDEASTYNGDFDQLFYLISGGKEKGRLDSNAQMKGERAWKSIIITTSEFQPTSNGSTPNGIKARCFNITDTLTMSAENSDRIKTVVTNNYAVAGTVFVQWILDNKINCIENDYLNAKSVLFETNNKLQSNSSLTQRIFSKLAIILQTSFYVAECFNLELNSDEIVQYLISLEKVNSVQSDLTANTLDVLTQEISRNSSKYLTPDSPFSKSAVGKITEDGSTKTISILKSEFQLICRRNKIQNAMQILKELKKKGVLQTEPDRLTRRVRLSSGIPEVTCYVFEIPDPKSQRNYISSDLINANRQLTNSPVIPENDGIDF